MNFICKFHSFDNIIESFINSDNNCMESLCKGHETDLRVMSSRTLIINRCRRLVITSHYCRSPDIVRRIVSVYTANPEDLMETDDDVEDPNDDVEDPEDISEENETTDVEAEPEDEDPIVAEDQESHCSKYSCRYFLLTVVIIYFGIIGMALFFMYLGRFSVLRGYDNVIEIFNSTFSIW